MNQLIAVDAVETALLEQSWDMMSIIRVVRIYRF